MTILTIFFSYFPVLTEAVAEANLPIYCQYLVRTAPITNMQSLAVSDGYTPGGCNARAPSRPHHVRSPAGEKRARCVEVIREVAVA